MGVAVIFTYEPLWNTLKKKGISQYDLIKVHHVSTGTLDSLRKNKSVTMNTLHDLCIAIDCQIQDVVQVIKENEEYVHNPFSFLNYSSNLICGSIICIII